MATNAGIQYDAAGNLINDSTHSYKYDADGNLISVDNGATASYVYDALNRRVRVQTASATNEYIYRLCEPAHLHLAAERRRDRSRTSLLASANLFSVATGKTNGFASSGHESRPKRARPGSAWASSLHRGRIGDQNDGCTGRPFGCSRAACSSLLQGRHGLSGRRGVG